MGFFTDPSSAGHIVLYTLLFLIPITICIGLLAKLIYHFMKNTEKIQKIKRKFKILSLLSITSFICTLLCYFIADGFQYDVFWQHESYAMTSFFWGHGNATAYILFVERIKTAFGQTQFNPSNAVYTYFHICIAFVYLCQMYIVVFLFLMFDTDIDPNIALLQINIVNGIEIIIQLILSISLIFVFVKNLNKIIEINNFETNKDVRRLTKVQLDQKQNKLVQVVTKQTVLSIFAASSTVLWLFCAAIMDIDWDFYPNSSMMIKHSLHFMTAIFLMNDCIINSFAVFLSFPFHAAYYNKLCKKMSRILHKVL